MPSATARQYSTPTTCFPEKGHIEAVSIPRAQSDSSPNQISSTTFSASSLSPSPSPSPVQAPFQPAHPSFLSMLQAPPCALCGIQLPSDSVQQLLHMELCLASHLRSSADDVKVVCEHSHDWDTMAKQDIDFIKTSARLNPGKFCDFMRQLIHSLADRLPGIEPAHIDLLFNQNYYCRKPQNREMPTILGTGALIAPISVSCAPTSNFHQPQQFDSDSGLSASSRAPSSGAFSALSRTPSPVPPNSPMFPPQQHEFMSAIRDGNRDTYCGTAATEVQQDAPGLLFSDIDHSNEVCYDYHMGLPQ